MDRLTLRNHDWSRVYVDDNVWCQVVQSVRRIGDQVQVTQTRLFNDYISTFTQYANNFWIAAILVPIALTIGTFLFAPIIAIFYLREIKYFHGLLLKTEPMMRVGAAKPLGRRYIQSISDTVPVVDSSESWFVKIHLVILFLLFAEIAVLVALIFKGGYDTANLVMRLESFTFSSNTRLPRAFEVVIHTYNAWIGMKMNSSLTNVETEVARAEQLMGLI
jgi:hypothetical protein